MAVIAHCALNVIVYNDSRIKIFDLEGGKYGSNKDTKWYMSCWDDIENCYVNCETPIFSASEQVEDVIGYYTGLGNEVATITVSNTIAIALFLEGILTIEHFKAAQSGHAHIILNNVSFCGKDYSVLIRDERFLEEHVGVNTSNRVVA